VPEYRPTLDGYYVPTDLGNIGRNINDQLYPLKVLLIDPGTIQNLLLKSGGGIG
jgi:hypothetical protein